MAYCEISPKTKDFGASTGFEPVASEFALQYPYNGKQANLLVELR